MQSGNRPTPVALPVTLIPRCHCFGCSRKNPHGLALEMYAIEDGLASMFVLPDRFESYPGVIHGGIVSTVLDEVMGNVLAVLDKKLCFTVSMRLKYFEPLAPNREYRAVARVVSRPDGDDGLYKVEGDIYRGGDAGGDGEPLISAVATYAWMSEAQAKATMSLRDSEEGLFAGYVRDSEPAS